MYRKSSPGAAFQVKLKQVNVASVGWAPPTMSGRARPTFGSGSSGLGFIFRALHLCHITLQQDAGSVVEILEFATHALDHLPGFGGYRNQAFHCDRDVDFAYFRQVDLATG